MRFGRLWKRRSTKPYKINHDDRINAIFGDDNPDWFSWLYWFYPLINASFLTPIVVLTGSSASISSFFLITLNIGMSLWHMKQLIYKVFHDQINWKQNYLHSFIVIGFALLGLNLALATLPLAIPNATLLISVFYVANFISSLIIFSTTACRLMLPWLVTHFDRFAHYVRGKPTPAKTMPVVIHDLCEQSNSFFNHNASIKQLIQILQKAHIKQPNETEEQCLLRFREKVLNLCFTYTDRKSRKFAGPLKHGTEINKVKRLARLTFEEGKITPNSNIYNFFFGRRNKLLSTASYELKCLSEIVNAANKTDNRENIIDFLNTVDKYVVFDYLENAVTALNSPEKVDINATLDQHIYFETDPKSVNDQINEIKKESCQLLQDRVLRHITKLHDEVGLTMKEIIDALREDEYLNQLPQASKNTSIDIVSNLLTTIVRDRKNNSVTLCPLANHDCNG